MERETLQIMGICFLAIGCASYYTNPYDDTWTGRGIAFVGVLLYVASFMFKKGG